jgi:circadian clock protein KaiC
MLDAGYWRGSSTLVVGPAGSGKTLMGLHFVLCGAELGEPGLIATLQENPSQLERMAQGFGWSLDAEGVELMYRSAVDIYADEWVYEVLALIERSKARRLLIDSLDDLRRGAADGNRFREFLYSLLQRCARADVSVLLTMETLDLYGIERLSTEGISNLSDNVILLQYLRGDSRVKRGMTVLKSRASRHDPAIREFEITSEGFTLGETFPVEQDLG